MDGETNQAIEEYVDSERGRWGGDEEQRCVLGLYRRLAGGEPVTTAALARDLGEPEGRVGEILALLPSSWIERDGEGLIAGVCGLGLAATRHRLTAGGRTLFAWCAFDCLFLPELLDQELGVASTCPVTGAEIALTVTPKGVVEAQPQSTVMSFVTPGIAARRRELRQVFCRHINFFASDEAAATRDGGDGSLILDLAAAHALARRRNRAVFSEVMVAAS